MSIEWIRSFELFLFDFDGLLVNTEELHFAAYIEMCRARGYVLSWDFYRFCLAAHFESTGMRDAIYEELPSLKEEEPRWEVLHAEKKRIYLNLLRKGSLHLLPGVERLLKALEAEGIRRCVATHSPREQIEEIKAAIPALQTIPVWITREDYINPKPAPDAYLTALARLQQPGDRVIGFEDSIRGAKALIGAHVQPVLICPAYHPQLSHDLLQKVPQFTSFEEIPDHAGPLSF